MNYYSTNGKAPIADLQKAVVKGLAEDRGLYMPEEIKILPKVFFENIHEMTFQQIAYNVASAFFGEDVDQDALQDIVYDTLSFDCPVVKVKDSDKLDYEALRAKSGSAPDPEYKISIVVNDNRGTETQKDSVIRVIRILDVNEAPSFEVEPCVIAEGNEIGDSDAYDQWLKGNNYSTEDSVVTDKNEFGGKTVQKPDGTLEYYDKNGNLAVKYENGKYYDKDGNEIGDKKAYEQWLKENGPKEGEQPKPGEEKPGEEKPEKPNERKGAEPPEITDENEFGGKTVKGEDGTITIYDKDNNVVATWKDGKYYDRDGNEIPDLSRFEDGNAKVGDKQPPDDGVEVSPPELTDKNQFGGKTVQGEDGTITIYDKDNNVVATYKDGKYYSRDGKEIPDYNKFVGENKPADDPQAEGRQGGDAGEAPEHGEGQQNGGGSAAPEVTDRNDFGGKTVEGEDGTVTVYDKDNNVVATYKDGRYYARDGKEIPDYDKFVSENKPEGAPTGPNDELSKYLDEQFPGEGGAVTAYDGDGNVIGTTQKDYYGYYTSQVVNGNEERYYSNGSRTVVQKFGDSEYDFHYNEKNEMVGFVRYDENHLKVSVTENGNPTTEQYTSTYYKKDGSIDFVLESETFDSVRYTRKEYPSGDVVYQRVYKDSSVETLSEEEYYDVVGRG